MTDITDTETGVTTRPIRRVAPRQAYVAVAGAGAVLALIGLVTKVVAFIAGLI